MSNHTPGPWKIYNKSIMSENGRVIFKTTNNNREPNLTFSDALRIVKCVNAMEGIENPQLLRKYWDEQMFNQVKSNYVKTMLLTQEELQKLGEQYKNQEETPYIETSQPKDAPTKADIEELLSYMTKYNQLKEVIQNMVDRLDEGGEMTLTQDSIIVLALKAAIK